METRIILETPRLLLREFAMDDARHLFELNSDPEVVRYVGDGAFASLADAEKFIENYDQYEKYGMGRWAVILKDRSGIAGIGEAGGIFTGWCGLKFQPELSETGEVDLGYRFMRKFWGQQIATESAKACVEYGFGKMGLKRIVGRVMAGNEASAKVLEKCGLHYVKEAHFDEHPGMYYEIENPTWNEKPYTPIDCNYYDELEALATQKKQVTIIYRNDIGVKVKVQASIKTFFTKDKIEYLETDDELRIRLDHIVSVDGKELMPSS